MLQALVSNYGLRFVAPGTNSLILQHILLLQRCVMLLTSLTVTHVTPLESSKPSLVHAPSYDGDFIKEDGESYDWVVGRILT
jgi:hypothetical protein